jgi:hypothetical protein
MGSLARPGGLLLDLAGAEGECSRNSLEHTAWEEESKHRGGLGGLPPTGSQVVCLPRGHLRCE